MSKKREARVERQLAKQLKQQERQARIAVEVEARTVRTEYPARPKRPRTGADPSSVFHMQMRWSVEGADRDGVWSWEVPRDWGDEAWEQELKPKLEEFQKLTWAEIERQAYGNDGKRHRSHHTMETESICQEAQDRLLVLERAFPETLFRFRLGNLPRLWGERIVDEFQVIWYDPTHQIYPVK